jgi:hypothetical protein
MIIKLFAFCFWRTVHVMVASSLLLLPVLFVGCVALFYCIVFSTKRKKLKNNNNENENENNARRPPIYFGIFDINKKLNHAHLLICYCYSIVVLQ